MVSDARQRPGRRGVDLAKLRRLVARALLYVGLLVWLVIAAYPFLWVVTSSLKSVEEYVTDPMGLPKVYRFDHWTFAWKQMRFQRYFLNSLFVSATSVVGSLLLSSTAAFAFARFKFRFSALLWGFVMFSFLLPGSTGLYPLVIFAQKVGLYGSLWALIVIYSAGSVPWNAFFLRGYMETIPRELEEAAIIDGAGAWQVFWRIIIPLSGPALSTMAVFAFLGAWGDFILPIMLAKSDELFTVTVGTLFLTVSGRGASDPTVVASGLLISILPCVLIYILLQRYVVEGLSAGALKGV